MKAEEQQKSKQPLISVIVPVYRCADTLQGCVTSILTGQEYENLEVLLIANGIREGDASYRIACDLAESDERVKAFLLEKAGVSAARNEGIRQAKGQWIRFVDSDDMLPPKSLGRMMQRALDEESDMVIGGYEHLYFGKSTVKMPEFEGVVSVKKESDRIRKLYRDDYFNPPWNKLYRKELMGKGFPEDMNLGEDLSFNLSCLLQAEKISVMKEAVYRYRQDERSTTLSGKAREDKVEICMLLYRRAMSFFERLYGQSDMIQDCSRDAESKVVETFLDEICRSGMSKERFAVKAGQVRTYTSAVRKFTKGKSRDIRLRYPDHKVLCFFAKKGAWKITLLLTCLRGTIFFAGHRA